uniref:Sulfotransferase n=1 Tax=Plectus sambesii TaxID=2011161 RepID=A0A914V6V1_9BILA
MNLNYSEDTYDIYTTALFHAAESRVCMIAKNGHTAIQYVSCLLAAVQSGNRRAQKWMLSKSTFKAAYSPTCNELNSIWGRDDDNYKKIVFVRDPLERFVSGWLFVCRR